MRRELPFGETERGELLSLHASRCWEEFCRPKHPGASRFWEPGVELDLVWSPPGGGPLVVAECKWAALSAAQESALAADLRRRFARSSLAARGPAEFRVLSQKDLPALAAGEG